MPEIKRSWMGGYVTVDSHGREVFCIRKQIGGKRFDISTGDDLPRARRCDRGQRDRLSA